MLNERRAVVAGHGTGATRSRDTATKSVPPAMTPNEKETSAMESTSSGASTTTRHLEVERKWRSQRFHGRVCAVQRRLLVLW
jgi:hypothetical protein